MNRPYNAPVPPHGLSIAAFLKGIVFFPGFGV